MSGKPSLRTSALCYATSGIAYFGIAALFGLKAAMFFALGFIVAAVMCFWEAGRNKSDPPLTSGASNG